MINLNNNDIISLEEFVLFFLIKQSTIDGQDEEVNNRKLGIITNVKEVDPNRKKLETFNHMAGSIVDTTYDHVISIKMESNKSNRTEEDKPIQNFEHIKSEEIQNNDNIIIKDDDVKSNESIYVKNDNDDEMMKVEDTKIDDKIENEELNDKSNDKHINT